jgi:hypothetical protein
VQKQEKKTKLSDLYEKDRMMSNATRAKLEFLKVAQAMEFLSQQEFVEILNFNGSIEEYFALKGTSLGKELF